MTVPIEVHALRRDGFAGEIKLRLVDAPEGYVLSGWLPSGKDKARITLTVPGRPAQRITSLHLEGTASIRGREVRHTAVAADDMMQAFIYHHLVAAQEWLVAVEPGRRNQPPWLPITGLPLLLKPDEATVLRVRTPRGRPLEQVRIELDEPPDGISLDSTEVVPGGAELVFIADERLADAALKGNLILNAFLERPVPQGGQDGPRRRPRPISLGALPAIPFEVVSN
jgi:hypothetical protein